MLRRLLLLLMALMALAMAAFVPLSRLLVVDEVTVPQVVGLEAAIAESVLLAAGLDPRPYLEQNAQAKPREVLSQSPSAGAAVRPGRIVAYGVNRIPEAVALPNLLGFREREAVQRLGELALNLGEVLYVYAEVPSGTVVAQMPAAGSMVAPLDRLSISVSRGAVDTPFALPNLRGLPVDDAVALLASLGVRQIERIPAAGLGRFAGEVTDQRPLAGAEVLASTPVALVFEVEGTAVVRVPELRGLELWQAQLRLADAQLQLGAVRSVDDPILPFGVIDARPADYTLAGSTVSLIFNAGGSGELPSEANAMLWPIEALRSTRPAPSVPTPVTPATPEPPAVEAGEEAIEARAPLVPPPGTSRAEDDGSRTIPFRFDPANVGIASLLREPYRLRLLLNDEEGERVVFDQSLAAAESLEIPVRVMGDGLMQTYINGIFFQAWSP